MSANTILQVKKSGVSGNTPSDLNYGELAINYADKKLFFKNAGGDIDYITTGNTFSTINANSSLIISTSPNDILDLVSGSNIVITGDGIQKTITIGVSEFPNFGGTVSINSHSQISSTAKTTSGLSQAVVDSFNIASIRSAKYYAQITSGSNYHVIELRVLHDGSTVYMVQYGEMFTSVSLGNFDAEISGSSLNLLFTPLYSPSTIKVTRHGIPV